MNAAPRGYRFAHKTKRPFAVDSEHAKGLVVDDLQGPRVTIRLGPGTGTRRCRLRGYRRQGERSFVAHLSAW
jgi:hypothetical protein